MSMSFVLLLLLPLVVVVVVVFAVFAMRVFWVWQLFWGIYLICCACVCVLFELPHIF